VPTDLFYAAYPESSVRAVLQAVEVQQLVDDFVRKLP
jgi:hypothetical protein